MQCVLVCEAEPSRYSPRRAGRRRFARSSRSHQTHVGTNHPRRRAFLAIGWFTQGDCTTSSKQALSSSVHKVSGGLGCPSVRGVVCVKMNQFLRLLTMSSNLQAINGSSTPNPFTIRNELSMSLALWGRMLLEQAKVQGGDTTCRICWHDLPAWA